MYTHVHTGCHMWHWAVSTYQH